MKSLLGLSLSLAKANFKLRNEGSYLGIFWYLLAPLLMFAIILLITKNTGTPLITNYPVYLLIGLIMFNFFTKVTMLSTDSIKENIEFTKSIKINYESFIISNILQFTFSHLFEIIVLIVFMLIFKVSLAGIIFYPFVFILMLFFTLGLSFLLACLGAYVNDMKNVWDVLSTLAWFVTPIFYILSPTSLLYKVNLFNPMFYFIDLARSFIIYPSGLTYSKVFISIAFSLFFFILGLSVFEKYKNKFAEKV